MTEQLRDVQNPAMNCRQGQSSKDFFLDLVQQRFVDQNIENPVPQMLEQLGEVPKHGVLEKQSSHGLNRVLTALRGAECRPGAQLGV